MKSKLWIHPGVLLIYGKALDAKLHHHNAIQIVWPATKMSCRVSISIVSESIVIAAGIEHQLEMQQGWVLLIEPQSYLGEQMNQYLAQKQFRIIDDLAMFEVSEFLKSQEPTVILNPLFKSINLDSKLLFKPLITTKDLRIQKLQTKLNQCFKSSCIKPEKWLAAEVASDLFLSESRFLHLFKQEMQIPWRPYLLWRRLLCAIVFMQKGGSATNAAYQAGFSDSAHLSRTFRSKFGISIRQAQASFK